MTLRFISCLEKLKCTYLSRVCILQTGSNRSSLPLLVAFLDRFGCYAGLLVCHVRCYLVEYESVILLNYRSSASKSALSIPAGKLQCIQRYLTIFASMGKDLAIVWLLLTQITWLFLSISPKMVATRSCPISRALTGTGSEKYYTSNNHLPGPTFKVNLNPFFVV